MRRIYSTIALLSFVLNCYGQSLTLSELTSFVKMDVSGVNDYLERKHWTYSTSVELEGNYRTSWGYDISAQSKASNWLYIDSKKSKLNWVTYETTIQDNYLFIVQALKRLGIKKISSRIDDKGELISFYVGKKYTYQLTTLRNSHSIIIFNSIDVIDAALNQLKEEETEARDSLEVNDN